VLRTKNTQQSTTKPTLPEQLPSFIWSKVHEGKFISEVTSRF
jgi:hypothetical protein